MERVDPKSRRGENTLLVIDQRGRIFPIRCPFRVLCIDDHCHFKKKRWYVVTKVSGEGSTIRYKIGRSELPHVYFRIFVQSPH